MNAWTLQQWRDAALSDGAAAVDALRRQLEQRRAGGDPAWISLSSAEQLAAQFAALAGRDPATLPLYGVPFAVKDNIDVAGLPTTCACPAYAYLPTRHARSVQRLVDAGALVMGKTNLDQFATGLNGSRSPYGPVPNTFNPAYVSGGSSSGSAVAVACGQVPFSLGTDTAGSGRVPAGFNNIVGLKPTRGWIGNTGMVPACRSLDCTSVFAATVEDALKIAQLAAGPDADDVYSRPQPPEATAARLPAAPHFLVPRDPQWYGDRAAQAAFARALQQLRELGVRITEVDFSPLFETAALLYDGPWVVERQVALGSFLDEHAELINPVVRQIVEAGRHFSAADLFNAEYRRMALQRQADALMAGCDALLVPTSPTIHTLADMLADPVRLNSQFGLYTNFVNLLDWCALALPAGLRSDGLPAGITLIAPAWRDHALAAFGRRWQQHAPWTFGATGVPLPPHTPESVSAPAPGMLRLAVVGAHLSGMPLNGQLIERGAVFVEQTLSSDAYRLYALPGTVPPKPGLVRGAPGSGQPIVVELWDLPLAQVGSFLALIDPPLGLGSLLLADGRQVNSFICEGWALDGALDITAHGGWRAYRAAQTAT